MEIFTDINSWQTARESDYNDGSIGFVPTMGSLHKGHLSLVRHSLNENDYTVVSIFLNPTQFNDPNDLKNYPCEIEPDRMLLEEVGVDALLRPDYEQIYNDGYRYQVIETEFSKKLCGATRTGHFDGVLTVVMKLLNIVRANRAYFGEKDYQQFQLIKDMARAFFLSSVIVPCPTIRESDGLAASSRNLNLNAAERKLAPSFVRRLRSGQAVQNVIAGLEADGFQVDYVEDIGNRRFGAVYLGQARLVDNIELKEISK